MGGASLLLAQALHAATAITVPNGGFDSTANWSGDFRAGDQGGFGWHTGYFGGSYPTNNTFATTLGSVLTQSLTGNTFVAGNTYTLSVDIFSVVTYAPNAANMWSLGFTADGTTVARDHWFSEELDASKVSAGNGGTIPDSHIITVDSSTTGLTTVTLSYTATAADAGKVIGIQLAGDTQDRYTLANGAPTPSQYYAMMDNVTLSYEVAAVPEPSALALGAAGVLGLLLRRRRA